MPSSIEASLKSGKIYIVGTGPGSLDHMTNYARRVIQSADVVVGYQTYLHLIRDIIKEKETVSTGMTQETERCQKAIELARKGKIVAVISGGDPGIYAMAGLVLELLRAEDSRIRRVGEKGFQVNAPHPDPLPSRGEGTRGNLPNIPSLPRSWGEGQDEGAATIKTVTNRECPDLEIEIIPGISALNACAAKLGAPIMHDFASISLSDRLTPWELIEKRLEAAANADFVMVLYNPKSKGRVEHLTRARDIMLKHKKPTTPVGIVKGAGREDERIVISDLEHLTNNEVDMQTTVIIGNSQTFVWNDWMVTPRGYGMEGG